MHRRPLVKSRRPTHVAESLERRRLLAASLSNGVLQVDGTSSADAIAVALDGVDLVVTTNGTAQRFAKSSVTRIDAALGAGDDTISLGDGVDTPSTIDGGDGGDTLSYAASTAAVTGSLSAIVYFSSPETVTGTARTNANSVATLTAVEAIAGGSGADTLTVNSNAPSAGGLVPLRIDGNGGDDRLTVLVAFQDDNSGGAITADGDAGDDSITFDGVVGTLNGGDGDDTFGNLGDDASADIHGGAGVDSFNYSNMPGIDYTMPADLENLTANGGSAVHVVGNALDNVITVSGGTVDGGGGDDTLTGGDLGDTLDGGSGDDVIVGGAGDDCLIGGSGNDRIDPGAGDDRIDGGAGGGDAVTYEGRGGAVVGSISATLVGTGAAATRRSDVFASLTENGVAETDTGTGIEVLTGSANDDTLSAEVVDADWNAATNADRSPLVINGVGGDDTLAFRDRVRDGAAARTPQTVAFGGAGADTLAITRTGSDAAAIDYAMPDDLENVFVSSTAAAKVTGNGGANRIEVQSTSSIVYAGAGDDSVYGGAGDDTLYGQDGRDKIWGRAGDDRIDGGNSNDVLRGEDGDDKVYGRDGNDNVSGGEGSDRVYGDAGNDDLNGDGGRDIVYGGSGTDRGAKQKADRIFKEIEAFL